MYSLRQLLVFVSLVAACLGLTVAEEKNDLAMWSWFLPGAYLAVCLSHGRKRRVGRAMRSAWYAALGGALSCAFFGAPAEVASQLAWAKLLDENSPHSRPDPWILLAAISGAAVLGTIEGFCFGWLYTKIVADWNRRRRWRERRQREVERQSATQRRADNRFT